MKTIVSLLLTSAITASTYGQTPPDTATNHLEIGPACIVLLVGGVVLIGINRLCDRVIPPQPGTPPVAAPPIQPKGLRMFTNLDGTITTWPHNVQPRWAMPKLSMATDIDAVDVSSYGFVDTDADSPQPYFGMWALEIQTSTGNGWSSACTITGFVSRAGSRVDYYQGGTNALATYAPAGIPGHFANLDLGFTDPHRSYRIKNCLAR